MRGTWLALAALIVPASALAADSPKQVTFTKDVAPIFQEKCEACHRPDNMAPMSLITYEDARPWARVDRAARRDAPDAAVAHRQDDRHPEVQERSLAERRADRHDRALGGRRRAEGRSEGHAAAEAVGPTRASGSWPAKYGAPDLVVKSPDVHDAGRRAGRVVAAVVADRPHRAALGPRDRDPSGRRKGARKITHHALARLQQPEDMRRELFTNDPERRRRRPVHGMGGRQERRRDASRLGPPDAARLEDRLGDALSRGRRGDHRRTSSSASTSTRRARSRSTAKCWRCSTRSPAAHARSTSRPTR